MRKLYDFSKAKPNPYVGKLKRQITIRLETSTIDYFRELAKELGIPYQNLINMYLRECALAAKRPVLKWS
jgi:predicted DNA binding CopG/RHH family protein